MQKYLFKLLLLLCFVVAIPICSLAADPIQGRVRVKLQPEVAQAVERASRAGVVSFDGSHRMTLSTLETSLQKIKFVKMRRAFPCPAGREAEHQKYGLDLWYEIEFDQSVNPLEAKSVMALTPGVSIAHERRAPVLYDGTYTVVDAQAAPARAAQAMPFNDPRLREQWHYNNDGSIGASIAGADINLFKAWEICTGSNKVVVAVIDGGVDYSHEDLADNMWVNEAELNGTPGVDDDGNGYIDDIYGYNFCAYDGEIYPINHGTHVAGTVAAVNNNGKGVCGVAGGDGTPDSGARIMSMQVFDSRSGTVDADFAAAFIYAADMGATIAQCSWGWEDSDYYDPDVLEAIRYFTESARSNNMVGGLCFVSSSNTGTLGNFYPACMPEVIAVGAMLCNGEPASYSGYGPWVDVTAPGGSLDFDQAEGVLSTLPYNTYGFMNGTSMATPHVSGIAALILSRYGSPTLINESVRQQIVTSVNDLYSRYPQAEGYFGSGYVDAWKALQWGDGTAPAAVSDLKASPLQESVVLTWTIPESSTNNVNSHIIYYSDKPFDSNGLADCQSIVIDTKFCTSGDEYSYEVTDLAPLTTYYFAIVAVDRWSNASELSVPVQATTNAGPEMTLSRTAATLRTTDGVNWVTSTFDIGNTGEGLLRWEAYMRTMSSRISAFSQSQGLMTRPYTGRLCAAPAQAAAGNGQVVAYLEDFTVEDYPQEITNSESLYAFLGDSDTSQPNSMAQMFTVDADKYPNGFHLTHVNLQGSYGIAPVIEIYGNGSTLSSSTLLESITLDSSATVYYTDLPLTEGLLLAPGQTFYVVVHFKECKDRNYPLGMGLSNSSPTASHAYISNDLGQTWTRLSEALKGTSYEGKADRATWAISAISKFPDWGQIISLEPASGQLEGNSSATQTVTIGHNGTRVPNGTYRARILFDTNESQPAGRSINVNINVAGQNPDVSYNKIVQFGNLLVGQSKTVTIKVTNKGYGAFSGGEMFAGIYGDKISSTMPCFKGPEYLQSGIPARSTVEMTLTYAPTEAGSHTGQIIIKDRLGNELKINVQGAATDPAKLVTYPQQIEVGDLDANGEVKEVKFEIANEGNYPLQYVMPKFTDETLDEVASGGAHRFGYTWQSNLYGSDAVAYTGMPNIVGATDLSGQMGDYDYFSDPIDIGFDFPFYGKSYDKIYVSSLGVLSFAPYTEGSIYSPLSETSSTYLTGLGVISAYGFECQIGPNSRVECGKHNGNFVVNYRDVLVPVYGVECTPASFHFVLSPSGDIEIGFDKYDHTAVFQQGHNLWVGILDPEMADPMTITSSGITKQQYFYDDGNASEAETRYQHIGTGTVFRLMAPRPNMIRQITPASGIVAAGERFEITALVSATDAMYAGPTTTNLVVLSNDVVNPTSIISFNANIVGDLMGVFDLAQESIDFGQVFRTATASKALSVQNHGRNTLTIESVDIKDGKFSHNFDNPVDVAPGQSYDILINLPTETEGLVADEAVITTSVGSRNVPLSAEVIGVPDAKLSYSRVSTSVPYGGSRNMPLTITNTGDEPLVYCITTGNHVAYAPTYPEGASTKYSYVASVDVPAAHRDWVDIETTGLGDHYNYTYFLQGDVITVELPFEFYFFGKPYSKMYVYNTGFVSFTERNDENIWLDPPAEFPDGTIYNNLIAPYWGLHSMDISSTAGIYLWADQDQAVVSFIEYGNSMNYGVDYQLVLRADGSFTFNYKKAYDNGTIFAAFGVAGISDDESQGFAIPERYIQFGNSVHFSPIVETTVKPGESSRAAIRMMADALAGTYDSTIDIATNIPTKPVISVPVQLTITGDPKPVFPEDIEREHVAGFYDEENADEFTTLYGAMWYAPINVRNEGAAAYTITSIDMECPKDEYGDDLFGLYWYGTFIDGWSGAETVGWTPYHGEEITVGRSQVRMAVPMLTSDNSVKAWTTPGIYDIKLTFHLDGVADMDTKELRLRYIVTDCPSIAIDRDEIVIENAADDQIDVETIVISNTEGAYKLVYDLTLDTSGAIDDDSGISSYAAKMANGEAMEAISATEPQAARMQGSIKPHDVGNSGFLFDTPADDMEFLRALYWPANESSLEAWNYGTTTQYNTYKAATAYTGPEGGFNISHIYSIMLPYALDNKDVVVEIHGSDPQNSNNVLGRGAYHIGEVTTGPQDNVRMIVPLDQPVFIAEGQPFWVVITYPVGQPYPATLTRKQDNVISNRYLGYWDNFGWFDVGTLFAATQGSLGYVMTCIETVAGDDWVRFLESDESLSAELTGEIAPGESKEFKIRISAASAPKETENRAAIVVRSNDPNQPVVRVPITLSKNASPVITLPAAAQLVSQGKSINITAKVVEPESEDMQLLMVDNGKCAKIYEILPIGSGEVELADDGTAAAISGCDQGVWVKMTVAPDFDALGYYTITLYAADSKGHERQGAVNYVVEASNQPPIVIDEYEKVMHLALGQTSQPIDLTEYFFDPEGEDMTYDLSLSKSNVVEVYRSGDNVIFRARSRGLVTVTVTATDASGASSSFSFDIDTNTSGIDGISVVEDIKVYPNPCMETLYVQSESLAGKYKIEIYSISGALVYSEDANLQPGKPHSISASSLPSGPSVMRIAGTSLLVIKQ